MKIDKLLMILVILTVSQMYGKKLIVTDTMVVKFALENSIEIQKIKQQVILANFDFDDVRSEIYPSTYITLSGPTYSIKRDKGQFQNIDTKLYEEHLYEKKYFDAGITTSLKQDLYFGGSLDLEIGLRKNYTNYNLVNLDNNRYILFNNDNDYYSFINLTLSQPITSFWQNPYYYRYEVASKNYNDKLTNYKLSIERIIKDKLGTFFDLISDQYDLEIAGIDLRINELDFLYTEARFNKGFLSEEDFYKAKIDLENAKSEYQNRIVNFRHSKEDFFNSIGIYEQIDSLELIPPNIKVREYISFSSMYNFLSTKGKEIQQYIDNLEYEKRNLKRLYWKRYPDINLTLSYSWNKYDGYFTSDLNDYKNNGSWSLGLNVNFTLFDNGELSRSIQREKIALKQIQLEKKHYLQNLKKQVYSWSKNLESDVKNIRKNEDVKKYADKNFAFAVEKYKRHLITTQEYLKNKIRLLKSNKNLYVSRYNWLLQYYDIELKLGEDILTYYGINLELERMAR